MNTLKITDRNRLLTERHNLETAGIWELEIQGKKRKVYCPCNLNIVIGRRCNCHCGFCFFQGNSCEKQIDDETYLTGLDTVLRELQGFPVEITITGGEPTLYPERLISVMRMVKKYGFSNRTFSTNGTGLLDRIDGKPLLQYMKEADCIYNISLSRMAVDDAENRRIFQGDMIGSLEIGQIAVFTEVNDLDFRLSCNLLNNVVDSWDGIRNYMKFFGAFGITSFLFREIISPEKSISVSDIAQEMKREQGIEFLKTACGMLYDVDIYGYGEKLIKHYKEKSYMSGRGCAKPDQELITSLIYEGGGLQTTW